MKNLIVLRGCPGAGKSTWIKENGLEQYTLSPDNIRMLASAPILTETNTDATISQENETYVWSLLYELLEKRMQNGDFTIIDATHSRSTDFSRYNSLCESYRYRKYVVSFTDVPKEVCIERNHNRDAYKKVPDDVIEKMYARFATQEKTSGWVDVPRDKFWETFSNKVFDYNDFERIHIIGDIHGCFNPLKEYILKQTHTEMQDNIDQNNLAQFLNDEDAYIFVGDYLDRGLQNKEVLEFMINICQKKNVLLLEGNHERFIWYWANELDSEIKSREFMNFTVPQIREIDPSKMRQLYRKLGQMAYITFNGQEYFINHGGLNTFPEYLPLVSTSQMIRGVGAFKFPIDESYTENMKNKSIIQIHGHRYIAPEKPMRDLPLSFSLEDGIEFGGNLKVAEITKKGTYFHSIKNDLFRESTWEERQEALKNIEVNIENIVDRLRSNKYIRENDLGDGISSFNFTHKAFEKGIWDNETVKARGLFIDTINNKIVARGYEKFFNINEQETSKLFNLKRLFDTETNVDEVLGAWNGVTAYKKYNGFLGILSYYNDSLQFHSKSTNKGNYVDYFKNLFYKKLGNQQISMITEYLKKHDMSLTFEVIDLENDPHIIDEKESRIVLLDSIYNEVDFRKIPYSALVNLAKLWGLKETEYKQVYTTFESYRQLTEFYEEHKDDRNLVDTDIEGVVIESGKFMTKLKFSYYSFWKMMRGVVDITMSGKNVELKKLYNATANYFYKFIKDKYDDKCMEYMRIVESINRDDIKLSDLRQLHLPDEGDTVTITRQIKTRTENGYICELKDDVIFIGRDNIEKLKELKKKEDIISLRNEYYANGGI